MGDSVCCVNRLDPFTELTVYGDGGAHVEYLPDKRQPIARIDYPKKTLLVETLCIHEFSMTFHGCHTCNPFRTAGAERGNDVACETTCETARTFTMCRSDSDPMFSVIDSSQEVLILERHETLHTLNKPKSSRKVQSLFFWIALLAESLAFVHARLKELMEGEVKTWDVVKGFCRVVGIVYRWG